MSAISGIPEVNESEKCILALDASINKSYNGQGNTWFDISKQKNHCSPSNSIYMPTFVNENGEKYFEFAGRPHHQNFRSINNSPIQGSNMELTVIAGFRTYDQITQRFAPVISCGTQGGGTRNRFSCLIYGHSVVNNNPDDLSLGTDWWQPGGRRLSNGHGISNNINYIGAWSIPKWSEVDTSAKLYIDGYERSSRAYNSSAMTTGPLNFRWHIGNWQISRDDMDWYGRIYFVYVYNKALDSKDILRLSKLHSRKIGKKII